MSITKISRIDLSIGQYNGDGFNFYMLDRTEDEDNETKELIADHFDEIWFMVKRKPRDSDSKALFAKKYLIDDPDMTDLGILITTNDTDLPAAEYCHELKGFRPSEGVALTIALGKFIVEETVIDDTDGTES